MCIRDSKTSMDILPAGSDKGFAIEKICALFGISPAQIIFFGDSLGAFGNDRAAALKVDVSVNVGPACLKLFKEENRLFINGDGEGPDNTVRYLKIVLDTLNRLSPDHSLTGIAGVPGPVPASRDASRPLPGMPEADAGAVTAELARHDLNTFAALGENDEAVVLAVWALLNMC